MPNWCENDLYFDGTIADVAAVLSLMGADETPPRFDFNAVLPYPEPFKSLDDEARALEKELQSWSKARDAMVAKHGKFDGYNHGGYEWCQATWGTKWNASDVARRDYNGQTCVTFQTAWGPPRPVIAALHRKFPRVRFCLEFFEMGCAFAGGVSFLPAIDSNLPDWEPGKPEGEWLTKEYRGLRGG